MCIFILSIFATYVANNDCKIVSCNLLCNKQLDLLTFTFSIKCSHSPAQLADKLFYKTIELI